jgi:hypothetical protein
VRCYDRDPSAEVRSGPPVRSSHNQKAPRRRHTPNKTESEVQGKRLSENAYVGGPFPYLFRRWMTCCGVAVGGATGFSVEYINMRFVEALVRANTAKSIGNEYWHVWHNGRSRSAAAPGVNFRGGTFIATQSCPSLCVFFLQDGEGQ